jgi:hypothetical protein
MDKEAYDSLEGFVQQLLKQQYLATTTNMNNLNYDGTSTRDVEPIPGELLGKLYIGKDGALYFHSEKANPADNYKDDILIESADDVKKIRTKKLLRT